MSEPVHRGDHYSIAPFKLFEKRPFFPKSDWEDWNVAAGTQVVGGDVARERIERINRNA